MAQSICSCKDDSSLTDYIPCDTTYFTNHSFIYTQFDCDSSWLTFETADGNKQLLFFLEKDMIELMERLEPKFIAEYKTTLLFGRRLSSGSYFEVSYFLMNKSNGNLVADYESLICSSEDSSLGFLLYFSDSTLNTITIYFCNTGLEFKFKLPENRIMTTMLQASHFYGSPEALFDTPIINENQLSISYRYLNKGDSLNMKKDSLKINLNEYPH